jgi:class 3 adenylate cyclase
VELTCQRCGGTPPPDALFCPRCGHRVSESTGSGLDAEGEKRQISALFSDIVDSVGLTARLDPEDWAELTRNYQQHTERAVSRFGGHVARYVGDGVLVYFGYPAAHENDAEAAVRGGLAILEEIAQLNEAEASDLGVRLAVRIGIATGRIVLRHLEEDWHGSLAIGETMNLAARLQTAASPNSLVISESTRRLTAGLFRLEDLGPQTLKGFSEPTLAYQVLGPSAVRSRFEATRASGLTPLVGRARELAALRDCWRSTVTGEGRVVLVSGEPGIGKSRIVHAFREELEREAIPCHEASCWPHQQNTAFHPVLELIQRDLGWMTETPVDARVSGLERSLAESGLDEAGDVHLLAALWALQVAVPNLAPAMDAALRRHRTLAILSRWLLARADRQPAVVVLEDLHWSDPSTLQLLRRVLTEIDSVRLLLILTHRPEFHVASGEGWKTTGLPLERLTSEESARIIRTIVGGGPALPDSVIANLASKADGVPLFIEELTKVYMESPSVGPSQLDVPITLRDSLMARLDRLGSHKSLAQVCAVLGRQFDRELVRRVAEVPDTVVGAGLSALLDAGLVQERNGERNETYEFKHALVRDAAYESLLRGQRRKLHRSTVAVLERDFPAVGDSDPALLAYHCSEACLNVEACAYWVRAAERAAESYAGEEAVGHLDRAMELVGDAFDGKDRVVREQELSWRRSLILFMIRGNGDSQVMQSLERTCELSRRLRRPTELNIASALLAGSHCMRAEFEDGRRLSESNLRHLGETALWDGWQMPLHVVRSIHLAVLGSALAWLGRFREAADVTAEGMELHAPSDHIDLEIGMTDPSVVAYVNGGFVRWFQGLPDSAVRLGERSLELVREDSPAYSQSWAFARMFLALINLHRREGERARQLAEAVISLSSERGMSFFRRAGVMIRACALIVEGSAAERGIAELEQAFASSEDTETRFGGSMWIGFLAEGYRRCGNVARALELIALGLAFGETTNEKLWMAELKRSQGEVILLSQSAENDAAAEVCFRQGLELARAQGARAWELRCATSLHRLVGGDDTRAVLQEALAAFAEGHRTADFEEARCLVQSGG